MKQLPIGTQSFENLRKNDCIYTVRGVFLCIVIANVVKQSMRVQGGFVPRSDV